VANIPLQDEAGCFEAHPLDRDLLRFPVCGGWAFESVTTCHAVGRNMYAMNVGTNLTNYSYQQSVLRRKVKTKYIIWKWNLLSYLPVIVNTNVYNNTKIINTVYNDNNNNHNNNNNNYNYKIIIIIIIIFFKY
jgi:hypothetical protein